MAHLPGPGPQRLRSLLSPPRPPSTPTRCHCPGWGNPRHHPGLLETTRADALRAVQWRKRYRLRCVRQRAEGEFSLGPAGAGSLLGSSAAGMGLVFAQ